MLKMPKDYCKALWSHMGSRMSGVASLAFTGGGVFSAFFSGAEGTGHARDFWWVAAAICFVYANYRVWADERIKSVSESPDFALTLEHLDYEYSAKDNETVLVFAVSLLNRGAPSIAQFWGGTYQIGAVQETLKPLFITDMWYLSNVNGQNPIGIGPSEQISFKTSSDRVNTGEGKMGRAFFSLPGNRMAQIASLNANIEVSCVDFKGKVWSKSFIADSRPVTDRRVYPGEKHVSAPTLEGIPNEARISRGTSSKRAIRKSRKPSLAIVKDNREGEAKTETQTE